MGILERTNTLNGHDLFTLGLRNRNSTGKNDFTIHQYSASATVTGRATIFGSR
jgi:hypothetical protein